MYMCQDKCNRQVPQEYHRAAQVKDYVYGSFYCSLCSVVIAKGTLAYDLMVLNHFITRYWQCPCCEARPRQYFDSEDQQLDYALRMLRQSPEFRKAVSEHFKNEIPSDKRKHDLQKILQKCIRLIAAPPQQAPPHRSLDTYKEISMFPS